ncbi:M20 family metallo-hydrolase [Fusobacterium sp. PH5-44]|uniref:M20 family metallo-hydrolase n=1 Tax=unclassified Fusobacterium TaxID=2648384 RepID=UPI003D1A3AC0
MHLGNEIKEKLEILGKISETEEGVTRLYLTKEYLEARDLIEKWMIEAHLDTSIDAVGNLIGSYKSPESNNKTLVIGSHQDSVKNGGKYDGILGVILPIVTVKKLLQKYKSLPCNLKIISFAYEEGISFPNACMTSKAIAGTFSQELLNLEYSGKKLYEQLKEYNFNPDNIDSCKVNNIDSFLEVHIEQGPVLEAENLPVGIVSRIQACNRYKVTVYGEAGHSGTIPMNMRKDTVTTMSEIIYKSTEFIKSLENIVITFGKVDIFPGAVNIIPAKSEFTIDIRGPENSELINIMKDIENIIKSAIEKNKMKYELQFTNQIIETKCSNSVIERLKKSFNNQNQKIFLLPSGAGHDAQEMEKVTNIGMLFVRCVKGISHSPEEDVRVNDLDIAANIIADYIINFK